MHLKTMQMQKGKHHQATEQNHAEDDLHVSDTVIAHLLFYNKQDCELMVL